MLYLIYINSNGNIILINCIFFHNTIFYCLKKFYSFFIFNCFLIAVLCVKYVSYFIFNDIMNEQGNVEIKIF